MLRHEDYPHFLPMDDEQLRNLASAWHDAVEARAGSGFAFKTSAKGEADRQRRASTRASRAGRRASLSGRRLSSRRLSMGGRRASSRRMSCST